MPIDELRRCIGYRPRLDVLRVVDPTLVRLGQIVHDPPFPIGIVVDLDDSVKMD
ncbi:MAG: hypothetical protein R2706_20485 [Acidimicrobiales bacterium]